MISRMVSDSVVKGVVTAVEQEALEKMATKEVEFANLKKCLQCRRVDSGSCEDVRSAVVKRVCEVRNYDEMREELRALRNVAGETFKVIDSARGGNNGMKIVSSNCELVGFGGTSQERVDKLLEGLRTTVDAVCMKVDGMFVSSKASLCEGQREQDLSREVEDIVIQSVVRSLQEEFEEKLWEQSAQFCGTHMSWLEKLNDLSTLCVQLDSIVKSLSISETGLGSHGSHDIEHLYDKAFGNLVTPASLSEENKTFEDCNTHVPERDDFQQLKHMSKEELVNYFNDIIIKMKRDHESALHQETEKYFSLKREYLKERGSILAHRKDKEFDVLRKKIPEVVSKLEDVLVENGRFPALTNNVELVGKLKDRVEGLLSDNRQLRYSITDKKNEVRCLEEKLLQHSLAEENMLNLVADLKSALEESRIGASISDEVCKSALRELIGKWSSYSEDSNMLFLLMQEIYDVILKAATVATETTSRLEIEEPDIEQVIMQELCVLIFKEAINDANGRLTDLYRELQTEKDIRLCLERKSLEKENELKIEVEGNERLRQEILVLETTMVKKEKEVNDLFTLLSKEREQSELAYQELTSLREHTSQNQTLATVSNRELETLRAQHAEALEHIQRDKMEMNKLNQKLDQTKELLMEANNKENIASAIAQEQHDKLLLSEAREVGIRREMEMAISNIHGLTKLFDDFEFRISGVITKCNLRLEDATPHLKTLTKKATVLRKTGLMYKRKLEGRYADLKMAEAEVDLLGDEVDTLLTLLEKIYIALDHYSPILKHYPGIVETLVLVRRELSEESIKLSRSAPFKG